MDKGHIGGGGNEMPPPRSSKNFVNRFRHVGIQVNRVDKLHVAPLRDAPKCLTNTLDTVTEAFATMTRHEDEPPAQGKGGAPFSKSQLKLEVIVDFGNHEPPR